jgi:signal peptidase II
MKRLYFVVAAAAIAADQLTKALARAHLPEGREVAFAGKAWRWVLSYNTGMAFSMFRGASVIFFLAALAAGAYVTVRVWREPARRPIFAVGMALVAGGALGNAIDRIVSGRVTDFIQWGSWWPVFNVADALLFAGVALLVLEPKPRKTAQPA